MADYFYSLEALLWSELWDGRLRDAIADENNQ